MDSLSKAVYKALLAEVDRIIDDEATAASERVKRRIKERTVEISAAVLKDFSMERFGNELRISVHFQDPC